MSVSNLEKAICIHQIENQMARHVIYHARCRHREEIENIWVDVKENDALFAGDWGSMPGEAFWNNYALATEKRVMGKYTTRVRKRPDFAKQDYRCHEMSMHLLASPIIEVAGDGKSARGLWYTPGFLVPSSYEADRTSCTWFWERYGGDFVLDEDGIWKFLHLRVAAHLMAQMDFEDWTTIDPLAPDPMGRVKSLDTTKYLRQDAYTYLSIPTERPGIPTPYETLSETITYKEVKE